MAAPEMSRGDSLFVETDGFYATSFATSISAARKTPAGLKGSIVITRTSCQYQYRAFCQLTNEGFV